jgi:hypothetical protein
MAISSIVVAAGSELPVIAEMLELDVTLLVFSALTNYGVVKCYGCGMEATKDSPPNAPLCILDLR